MAASAAVLSNYLWVPKASVRGTPEKFARDWLYQIELLKTPEGRIAQQQISFLRQQASQEGLDPDDILDDITEEDFLTIKNFSEVGAWWALCAGNIPKTLALAKRLNLDVKDKRVEVPWSEEISQRLKMVMTPRDYQPKPFWEWQEAGYGVFHAQPAFGKTFIMCWGILERQQYTIVLVPTDALADQFITRFRHGSPRDDEETDFMPVTNCAEVEEELGIEIVGRYRSGKDLFPVTVATWQSFSSESGRKALKAINKSFGFLLVDEAHMFAAPVPASVVNSFHAKVKQGVTATPARKDQMEVGLYDVVGPVTAVGSAPQLPVTAYMIATGCKYPARRGMAARNEFTKIVSWLLRQPDRDDLIVDWVHTDVAAGRKILILTDRVDWCTEMAKRLNDEDIPARAVMGGMSSKEGQAKRAAIIRAMQDGDIDVIVATKVFQAGVDIPVLDTLYRVYPQANAPQLQQEMGRIRRKYEGKKDPIFRYFVDEGHGLLHGCMRRTHNALVDEGCTVIPVKAGRKPDSVMMGGRIFEAGSSGPKNKGLRTIANKQSSAMSDLFSDLDDVVKQKKRYDAQMGKRS